MFRKTRFAIVFVMVVMATSVWHTNVVEAQMVVTDGLISFWTFDASDIEGKIVKDVFGDTDGTVVGDPKEIEGKVEEGMEFDGADDCIDLGMTTSLNIVDEITIEAWFKPYDLAGTKSVVAKAVFMAGQRCHSLEITDGKLGWYCNDGGGWQEVLADDVVPVNEWAHVAALLGSDDVMRMYVNGEEQGATATVPNIQNSLQITYIGRIEAVEGDRYFNGIIDEVRIYNKALSKDEIQQNYTATLQLAVESAGKLATTWGYLK